MGSNPSPLKEVPGHCANSDLAITRRPYEGHAMQRAKYTVQLLNLAGEILGNPTLPASLRLADLAALKTLGTARVKVLS